MLEYLFIVAIVILFYIRTLEYSIVIDDIKHYANHRNGHYKFNKEFFKAQSILGKFMYLLRFSRSRLYGGATFGTNTIHDHAFTTILHAITCCLIYAVWHSQVGLWTALLYAVNPINNQTAIWLNGRRYQIVIILCLLALLFKPLGFIFYMITPAFQLTGFFFPILYLKISPLFLFVPLVAVFLMRNRIKASYQFRLSRIWNTDQKLWSYGRLVVVIKSYGFMFFKMIYPSVTMMNYRTLIEWGVTKRGNEDAYRINWDFYKGMLALMSTGLIIVVGDLRLYGLFILLAVLQWSALVCAFQQLADRYLSLTNVFMMFVLSWLFHTNVYGEWFCALLFVYYATQLNVTMRMYRTIEEFFEYQMFFDPTLSRNRLIFADSYLQIKDVTRAWLIVERGLFHEPNDFELLFMAARCSASVGMIEKAEYFIQRAEQNFYIGQEVLQKDRIKVLRQQMIQIVNKHQEAQQQAIQKAYQEQSRQVRRQNERKQKEKT